MLALADLPHFMWSDACFRQFLTTKINIFYVFVAICCPFVFRFCKLLPAQHGDCQDCHGGFAANVGQDIFQWPYSVVRVALHFDFLRLFALTLKIVVFLLLTPATTQLRKEIQTIRLSDFLSVGLKM